MKKRKNCILLLLLLCQTVMWAQGTDRVAATREKLFNPDSKGALVVSYRGDWKSTCENSVETVRNANQMGVGTVEIDLRRMKDGELIVIHSDRVDRTATGKGYVRDLTLTEIKQLRLRNGCNIKTIYRVPTLEEVLLEAKGKVMLDLDKAFGYFHQVYELLEKTGTADLVTMKGNAPAKDVQRDYGKCLDKVIFMPRANLDGEDAIRKLNDYPQILKPVAIEFEFAHDTNPLPYEVKRIMTGRSRIWCDTLWDTHAGGHDDDCSLMNPGKGYGYLVENLNATISQMDRPAYLTDYLKYESRIMDCGYDWTYSRSEDKLQAPFVLHLWVEECFLKDKKNP